MPSSRSRRHLKAVLRPREGRRLPPSYRPGRVGELAASLPEGLADPALPVLLQRIDSSPFLGGNSVEVYVEGEVAMSAMAEAVRGAGHEVLLESYIFKDDEAGRHFQQELKAAARRGVSVRVLADGLGSITTRRRFWQEMEEAGVAVRIFNPLFSRLSLNGVRDHRKLLVVDRAVGFTGGMNIGLEYGSPFPTRGDTWRDTHARVAGPAAWEMAVVFREGWLQAGGDTFCIPPLADSALHEPGTRILTLDARPGRGHDEMAAVLAAIVGAARRRVWITNAYFAPGWQAARILKQTAERGVDVRLLLPGRSDVPLVRHAAHGYYAKLLAAGVRIFEYQTAVLHAKTLVADGLCSVIGSANLDFRSFLFNAESNLVILDPGTAAVLERTFEADLERSLEIEREAWRRRPLLHRAGDRLARLLTPLL